jgi:peptidyl-prolyl cis-trans isomerase SurA
MDLCNGFCQHDKNGTFGMRQGIRRLLTASVLLVAALVLPLAAGLPAATASEIAYIVNGTPITSYDIQRRGAFLRLQRRGAGAAADDMIDQTLHLQEMKRLRIEISDAQVDAAYKNFASSNKMSTAQLDSILSQSGVTREHFKQFIRSQIGWNQALQARGQATGANEQDAIRQMMKSGEQPSATEYILQQVIFVVPERDRGRLLAKRRHEAQKVRDQFTSCETSRDLVKGMIDVTVRNLGRILEPELPPDWADAVKSAKGGATKVRDTQRGVEFIGICSTRIASDDRVAQLVFEAEQAKAGKSSTEELSKTYTKELRDKAQIVKR